MKKSIFLFYCLLVHLCSATTLFAQQNDVLIPGVKKIKDVIIAEFNLQMQQNSD